jgi:mannitol-1-phosphate 5-dehydrogenase
MKYAIQFGAGNIGRGFMGQLFWEIGYRTIFIEADSELVKIINREGKYPLKLLDAYTQKEIDLVIDNIEAIDAKDTGSIVKSIKKADVICTAVGEGPLPMIAPAISKGLEARFKEDKNPIDIYLCENNLSAAGILKEKVLGNSDPEMKETLLKNAGFAGMVVARMVPSASDRFGIEDRLFAVADSYHKLIYDGSATRARPLPIEGMEPARNFTAVFERKLFTLNLTHAALAYLGYLKGYDYVHEPFGDRQLNPIIEGAMDEISEALLKKYDRDLDRGQQKEIIKDTKIRFGNPLLLDQVTRVARDPLRKLGPKDRLVGSAGLCAEQGIFPENISNVCGAALNYDYKDDNSAVKLKEMIEEKGIEKVLKQITGLAAEGRLGKMIIDSFYRFKNKKKDWKDKKQKGNL